jgi:hypothetical protein
VCPLWFRGTFYTLDAIGPSQVLADGNKERPLGRETDRHLVRSNGVSPSVAPSVVPLFSPLSPLALSSSLLIKQQHERHEEGEEKELH